MIDLLREMFWDPDAHLDAYTRATVLLAHAAVGAVLVAASLLTRRLVLAVSLVYALIWEGG